MRHVMFMMMVSIILLSGCNNNGEIKPIKEESLDFDIETANEMIKEKEKLIIQLATKQKVSSYEYQLFEKLFKGAFGDRARMFLQMFIVLGSEQETKSGSYLVQETFYPTVFHKGITITDAVIDKSYYENEFFNDTYLTIKQEYTGNDKALQGWEREYIFTEKDDGEWEIHAFSGEMNFVGEQFSMEYLELEE